MFVHKLTLLAFIGTLFACHQDRALKQEVNRTSHPEQKEPEEKSSELNPPVVDESVSIPAPITGAYLVCIRIASDPAAYQQKVGCRVESEGGVAVEDFKKRVEKFNWNYQGQGSSVDIKLLDDDSSKGWLAVFDIRANASSIQSRVAFELAFTLDGAETLIKSDIVLIWNEDCALPAIQFESLGEQNPVGTAIANQFWISHGVRFSTLSGTPVVLAGYNQVDPVGYYGGPSNVANYLAPNQNGGKFFITDRHKQAETTDTLVIEYDKPVKEASMDLIDIDFSETYVIRALNNLNQPINEVQFQAVAGAPRDGQLSRFVVRSPDSSHTIYKLHINGFNPPGALGIGFGIDNFSPRCAQ